jgi:hypothetical protein
MLARGPLDPARWREGDTLGVDVHEAAVWRPPTVAASIASRATLIVTAKALVATRHRLPRPDAFGWLLGNTGTPPFPLHDARGRASALVEALAIGDPDDTVGAATALLGLGNGLTPSGDDFVGGAFFARAFAADVAGVAIHRSRETIARVLTAAATLTNPISIALLDDMLHGRGHAPLHELANALAMGMLDDAVNAATRLVHLGHSSGWDILTGFLGGVLGPEAFVE